MSGILCIRDARVSSFPLRALAAISTARRPMLDEPRRSVFLRLEDDSRTPSIGEATPLPGWSRESAADVEQALAAYDFSAVTLHLDGDLLGDIEAAVARVDAALPSARFAVETTLLDLAAWRLGLPVHRLLSGGAEVTPVPLSALLDAAPDGPLVEQARRAMERGARTVKWKVGRPGAFERELAALRGLRAAVGPELAIRLDANQGFAPQEVEERLAQLAEIGPALVEEPCLRWLEATWSAPFPLAADESLDAPAGPVLVENAIKAGRCSAVVLKPARLGGVLACRALAHRAIQLGASAIVTHNFDGPFAMCAAAALALALPGPRAAAGLWPHAALDAFEERGEKWWTALPFYQGATIRPLDERGLGLNPT